MLLFLMIIPTVLLLTWALKHAMEGNSLESSYLLSALGALVVLGGLTTPWISFLFLERVLNAIGPDWISEILPDVISSILGWVGGSRIERLLSIVDQFGFIPGWALVVLIPAKSLMLRIVIVLVMLVGIITLLWFTVSLWLRHTTINRIMGSLQAVAGFGTAFLLLLQVPAIDAWGSKENMVAAMLNLISSAEMGWGVWLTWLGLIITGSGGILHVQGSEIAPSSNIEQEWGFS